MMGVTASDAACELPAASPTAGDVGMVLAQLVEGVDAVSLVSHSVGELNLLAGAVSGAGSIRSLGSWVHSTCGVFVTTGRVRRAVDVLRELSVRNSGSEESQLLRDALVSGRLTVQQVHTVVKEMQGVEWLLSGEARPAVYAHLVDACEGATVKDIKHLVGVVRESLAINHPDALEEPAGPQCGPSMIRDHGLGADNRYGIELRLTPSDYAAFTNAVTALLATEPEGGKDGDAATPEQQDAATTTTQGDAAPEQGGSTTSGQSDTALGDSTPTHSVAAQYDAAPTHDVVVPVQNGDAIIDSQGDDVVSPLGHATNAGGADVWGWTASADSAGERGKSFRELTQEPDQQDRLTALLVSVIESGAARCGGPRATLVVTQRESEKGVACHAHTRPGAPQPLTDDAMREVCCNATQYTETVDDDGNTVDLKVAKRYFTAHQRAALVARDQGCSFPGCNAPPHTTDGHHIIHWQDGGPTSVSNGTLLCGYHYAQVHRYDLHATLEPVTDVSGIAVKKVRWDTRPGSYTRHIYTT